MLMQYRSTHEMSLQPCIFVQIDIVGIIFQIACVKLVFFYNIRNLIYASIQTIDMKKHKHLKFLYTLYSLLTNLLIPFATIPVGIVFYYFSTATLPEKDINLIFYNQPSPVWAALLVTILIAPVYYLHCVFSRSEMSIKLQTILAILFLAMNLASQCYLSFREGYGLSAFFLFTIPQTFFTYGFHLLWVTKFRDSLFKRLSDKLHKSRS